MEENGQDYYYHNDHLGTPRKMTDSAGTVVWSADYTAFGEAIVDPNSTITSNLRFAGQYYDGESGLHYNWHRYYDPQTGRYITTDPIGLLGGINLFVYGNVNPINSTDRLGLWPSQKGSYIHQRAIYQVIGKNLPRAQHLALVEGQVISDGQAYQGPEFAFRHAMSGARQTPAEARILANNFIRDQFKRACDKKKEGNTIESLKEFSIGLHTLQDWTSPSHNGFQQWSGEEGRGEKIDHIFRELYNPGRSSELYRITKDAWEWYNKCDLPCGDLFTNYGVDYGAPTMPDLNSDIF